MLWKFCSTWSIPQVLFCIMICESVHLSKLSPGASELGKDAVQVGEKEESLTCNSTSSTDPLCGTLSDETLLVDSVNKTTNTSGVDVGESEESCALYATKTILDFFRKLNADDENRIRSCLSFLVFFFHLCQLPTLVHESYSYHKLSLFAVYFACLLLALMITLTISLGHFLPLHLIIWYVVPSSSNLLSVISCGWLVLMVYPGLHYPWKCLNYITISKGRIVVKDIYWSFMMSTLLGSLVALFSYIIVDRKFVETSFGLQQNKVSLDTALCFHYPIYIFYASLGIVVFGAILGSALRECVSIKDKNDLLSLAIRCKLIIFPALLLAMCANWYCGCIIMCGKKQEFWFMFVGSSIILSILLLAITFGSLNRSRRICIEKTCDDVFGGKITSSKIEDELPTERLFVETIIDRKLEITGMKPSTKLINI